MKRSEMVNIIKNALCSVSADYDYEYDECAQSIILAIEKAGMLPPPVYRAEFDDEPECDGYISEWEPE